jgi:hypothetical protein
LLPLLDEVMIVSFPNDVQLLDHLFIGARR